MTLEGLGEVFKGDSADTCAGNKLKFNRGPNQNKILLEIKTTSNGIQPQTLKNGIY
jgi:hypothetical protein